MEICLKILLTKPIDCVMILPSINKKAVKRRVGQAPVYRERPVVRGRIVDFAEYGLGAAHRLHICIGCDGRRPLQRRGMIVPAEVCAVRRR